MCLSLGEFRGWLVVRGLALSDDPPHFESYVRTPWGTRIPAAVKADKASGVGQVDYLRWLEEVLEEVVGHEVELDWRFSKSRSQGESQGGLGRAERGDHAVLESAATAVDGS